jgi:hypothetical protein
VCWGGKRCEHSCVLVTSPPPTSGLAPAVLCIGHGVVVLPCGGADLVHDKTPGLGTLRAQVGRLSGGQDRGVGGLRLLTEGIDSASVMVCGVSTC